MTPSAVGARLLGDDYQARYFWLCAVQLLTSDYVDAVELEAVDVKVVDDVVIHLSRSRRDALGMFEIDCCQLKYHVTRNGAFTFDAMLDPKFTWTDRPFLRRLHDAYLTMRVRAGEKGFRLRIISPWGWHPDDPIAACWATEGHLREDFFDAGAGTKIGTVRRRIATSLGITESHLAEFLRVLRFDGGLTLNSLNVLLTDRLRLGSLKQLPPDHSHNIYDDLGRKFIEEGVRSVSRDWLFQRLKDEGLIVDSTDGRGQITLRSRLEWAKKPLETQSAHLDLTELFSGRFPVQSGAWEKTIPERLAGFLSESNLGSLPQPVEVFFDCHLSMAFAAGSLLNPKTGLRLIPVQKTLGRGYETWESSLGTVPGRAGWTIELVAPESDVLERDVVAMISVTHEVDRQVEAYLNSAGLASLPRLRMRPSSAIGPHAVANAADGWNLATEFRPAIQAVLPHGCGKIHLFYSGPAALAFLIGANSGGLPPIQLYEHDFEGKTLADHYYPTLTLPLQRSS